MFLTREIMKFAVVWDLVPWPSV